VKTEKIVLFLGSKINFCSAVLIFGSRSMVALVIIVYFSVTLRKARRVGALHPLFFQKGGKGGGANFSWQYHEEFHG